MGMPQRSAARDALKWLLSPLVMTRGPRGRIYLTFDDGPTPDSTQYILDVLDAYEAKATFFMVGTLMDRHPAVAADVLSRGHTVGYHSYKHLHAGQYSIRGSIADLETIWSRPGWPRGALRLYRPPYGELTSVRVLWCLAHGIKVAMWSLDSLDSITQSADALAQRLSADTVRDGEVILFHDDSKITAEALPQILLNLRNAGFTFAAL